MTRAWSILIRALRFATLLGATVLASSQAIAGTPERGPCKDLVEVERLLQRPATLPLFVLNADDVPGTGRVTFPDTVIEIPENMQKEMGIRRITKKKELGDGVMSVVYLVDVEDLNGNVREMAWREFKNDHGDPEDVRLQLIADEAQGMRLQYAAGDGNPAKTHIVQVKTHIRLADGDFIVSDGYLMDRAGRDVFNELLPGHGDNHMGGLSLWETPGTPVFDSRVFKKRMDVLTLFTEQVSAAIEELKQHGIVHQDLKPGNIVIFGGVENSLEEVLAGKARFGLVDFGHARQQGSIPTTRTQPFGSENYRPPEVGVSSPATTARDTYALGVMLAEGMLGRRSNARKGWRKEPTSPTPGFAPEEIAQRIQRHRQKIRLRVSKNDLKRYDDLSKFVLQCLSLDPNQRPTAPFGQPAPAAGIQLPN